MEVFAKEQLGQAWPVLIERLRAGEVGILPTDTIYGLSGDVRRAAVVERVADLKQRRQPPTVLPHDDTWARQLVAEGSRDLYDRLRRQHRGAYTLLFPVSDQAAELLPPMVTATGLVGLRWPDHWISRLAGEAQVPLLSTSANVTGQPFMTSGDDLDPAIAAGVDFWVDEGPRPVRPSTLVWCNEDPPRFQER